MLNSLLALDDQCQGRCLHPSDGEGLLAVAPSVAQGVEAGSIHSEEPVSDGTGEPCLIERLIVRLVSQVLEALTYRLIGERRDPETAYGDTASSLLEDPALDEFALLPSITTVDDFGSLADQAFDDL